MSDVRITRGGDGVSVVTLARPKVNALDLGFLAEIEEALRAEVQDGCVAVVLTGEGPCFCAGVDTKAAATYGPEEQQGMVRGINGLVRTIYGMPVPMVAAVNGHALGGGLVIPIACDYRVVTTADCGLGLIEVRAGIPFPAVPMRVVEAEVDPSAARLLCLTGRTITPERALELRMADELAEPGALVDAALAVARELSSMPAYARVKTQVRAAVLAELEAIIESESDPMLTHWI